MKKQQQESVDSPERLQTEEAEAPVQKGNKKQKKKL